MQKIVEIFNTGDLSDVDRVFSPQYIDHQKPEGWDVTGPEEFRQIVTNAHNSLKTLIVTIEDLFAESDKVAARLQWHSVDLTGAEVNRETIDILRIENGKVIEHWGAEEWRSVVD